MRRYLDNALIFDLLGCILIGTLAYFFRNFIHAHFTIPANDSVLKFMDSIVKVATPLIGFLLTIVGIIVTFRNSFESQKPTDEPVTKINDPLSPPSENVFTKEVSKKSQFYGTDLHKKVMTVFLSAVYELGVVVFLFLFLQAGIFKLQESWAALITLLGFLAVFAAVVRSFYIYRMFLNVHTKN